MTYPHPDPMDPLNVETALIEQPAREYDSGIGAFFYVLALTLLACAPAIVILVWKAAL